MLARLKTLKITPVNAYKSPLLLTLIGCKQGDFLFIKLLLSDDFASSHQVIVTIFGLSNIEIIKATI